MVYTAPVFDNVTSLRTAVHMLGPQPTLVQRLICHLLRPREIPAAWLLSRHEDLHLRVTQPQGEACP